MCGIAGILGISPALARSAAPRMLQAMKHRGPDDTGTQIVSVGNTQNEITLLHARLAILDLSPAGHQPMRDNPPDNHAMPNWVVFNGEVFNYLEFHAALAQAGWPCRSRCDTEVILNAYRVWGADCVQKFRGMFAWCLVDSARQTAWFCRDRLGVKPLYIARPAGGGLLFASELRTLLAAGPELVPPIVNPRALESFLAQGAVVGLESIVENVTLLAPGQSLITDWAGNTQTTKQYWRIPFGMQTSSASMDDVMYTETNRRQSRSAPSSTAIAGLAETLRESVKMRLISDVPLGLFLSGGIDSTALATIAMEVADTPVQTITIGFDQPEWDESAEAAKIAQALGTKHHMLRLTGNDILADLPDVLAAIDQPTVDGFNTYYVSRAARKAGLTVAISGVGGDELFGGYASFVDVPRALRVQRRLKYLAPLRHMLSWMLAQGKTRRGAKVAEILRRAADPIQIYMLRRELFLPSDRRALLPRPSDTDPDCGIPSNILAALSADCSNLDLPNQMSLLETTTYMRNMLLRDADVFSMAHGLEIRTPLLDHQLVEKIAGLPGSWKLPIPHSKALLTEAVGRKFPAWVLNRPKRGFTFPWDAWLRGPMRDRAAQTAQNADLWTHLGINPDAPRTQWSRFMANDRRVAALQILALIVLADFATRHNLRRR